MPIRPSAEAAPDDRFDVVIIGAGGCGLTAALAARDAGVSVALLDRDVAPTGNTSWSVAMIPASATRVQRAAGVQDSPALFAQDLMAKTKGQGDPDMILRAAEESGPTVDWLMQAHGLDLVLLSEIKFPGHSRHRYHVPPLIAGPALHGMLLGAAERAGAAFLFGRTVQDLYVDADRRVTAVGGQDPQGGAWTIGCTTLILATDGFAANPDLVRRHIPAMADAVSYGHVGAQGDSLVWGEALGAATADLGAYQGHNLVHPQGLPMSWATIIDGGIQVNLEGRRFSNEMRGYSEQAAEILRQPGGVAWTIYNRSGQANAERLETYRAVQASGALIQADSVRALADAAGLPEPVLTETLAAAAACARGEQGDPFGRDFTRTAPLEPPYVAARVTGVLYHTQGGLRIDRHARVLRQDGAAFPNLFAGGGAARGVSGPADWGYLGGNGLLCALVFGRLAGKQAAVDARSAASRSLNAD